MFLRCHRDNSFEIIPEIDRGLGVLLTNLGVALQETPQETAPDDKRVDAALHAVALQIFSVDRRRTETKLADCPVYRFLVYVCVSKQGIFKKANEITPIIAKLQYWIRAVVYRQCKSVSTATENWRRFECFIVHVFLVVPI